MKNFKFLLILFLSAFQGFSQTDSEPEALGLPGDNLNLYAVLEIFQKSKTLEDFEKSINDKTTNVNNLDLDNDNKTDYIQVISEKEKDTHFIILQVALNSKEKQDIAVIEVSKDKNGKVVVQIIGDKDLYGKDYIVEPGEEGARVGTPNPGYKGDSSVTINNTTINNTTINNNDSATVSAWPVVVYLFSPVYVVYRSPWYWGYYPSYWNPWAPVYYSNYWGYHSHYYHNHYYRRSPYYRNPYHNSYYGPRRNSSSTYRSYRDNGRYRATYEGRTYRRPTSPAIRSNSNRPSTIDRSSTRNRATNDRSSMNRATTTDRATNNRPTTSDRSATNRRETTNPSSINTRGRDRSFNNAAGNTRATPSNNSMNRQAPAGRSSQPTNRGTSSPTRQNNPSGGRGR